MKEAEAAMEKINKEDKITMPDTSKLPDFSSENRQIHRDIRINQEIPDAAITFTPPENAKQVDSFQVGR